MVCRSACQCSMMTSPGAKDRWLCTHSALRERHDTVSMLGSGLRIVSSCISHRREKWEGRCCMFRKLPWELLRKLCGSCKKIAPEMDTKFRAEGLLVSGLARVW